MTPCTLWAVSAAAQPDPTFYDLYATAMRGGMFTGFLTLASFLLATKTLLVIQFRKDVYEKADYYRAHREQERKGKVFDPLRRFSNFLNTNVLLALASSVLQLTLGLVPSPWTAAICVTLPAFTIGYTVMSVIRVRRNLNTMFDWLDVAADSHLAANSPSCQESRPAA